MNTGCLYKNEEGKKCSSSFFPYCKMHMKRILIEGNCKYFNASGKQCRKKAKDYCQKHLEFEYVPPTPSLNPPSRIPDKCFAFQVKKKLDYLLMSQDPEIKKVLEYKNISLEEYFKVLLETPNPSEQLINGIERVYIRLATLFDYSLHDTEQDILNKLEKRIKNLEREDIILHVKEIHQWRDGAFNYLYGNDLYVGMGVKYLSFLQTRGYLIPEESKIKRQLEEKLSL